MIKHKCSICNKEFNSYTKKRDYCSLRCRDIGRKKRALTTIKCIQCGKEFTTYFTKIKNGRTYCSKSCSGKVNYSKKVISPKEIGKKISITKKGKIPKNIKLFTETGKKTRFIKGQFAKEKHPNWKDGITPINQKIRHSDKYINWRKAVFKRDNYRCQWCAKLGGKLNADHIFSFSLHKKKRFSIINGRTLCEKCHKERTAIQLSVLWKNQNSQSSFLGEVSKFLNTGVK